MSLKKLRCEPSITTANSESVPDSTGHSITDELPSTDLQTKALRQTSYLYYRGPFRVYFNRKEEQPRVVSIDNGSHAWEVVCKSLRIDNVRLTSNFRQFAVYPEPTFTFEGWGEVVVDNNGSATIR
jgi:hypothetical protein